MIVNEAVKEKASYVYELGCRAFREGKPCDPHIPMKIPYGLDVDVEIYLMESWMNGWTDESLMQFLSEKTPA